MKPWLIVTLIVVAIATIIVVFKTDIANKLVIKVLFSNKKYAKNIEVKTYVLTQDQMVDLFQYPDREPEQIPAEKLNKIGLKSYFVARVRNLGTLHAWGTLSCKVRCIHKPFKIPIISIEKQFCDNIICVIGVFIAETESAPYPDISYEWSELYTK